MDAKRIDPAQVASTVEWLEEEHRQLRARVGYLEQKAEQLETTSRDVSLRQRTEGADIEALRQHLGRVPGVEEGVRQTQEDIGDLRALITQQADVLDRAERTFTLELERMRLHLAENNQRLMALADELQPLPIRIQALGDHSKRLQDLLTTVHQATEELTNRQAILQTKVDLSIEQAHRLEQGLSALNNDFAPLRRADEVLGSRVQLAMDLARQIEQKMAEILAEEQARRELSERVEILRTERGRIQSQLTDLEHSAGYLLDRSEELARQLRLEGDRRQALTDRLGTIEGRLIDLRQWANEAVIQIWQTTEQHRRQDISGLQDQAKQLRDALQRLTRPSAGDEA